MKSWRFQNSADTGSAFKTVLNIVFCAASFEKRFLPGYGEVSVDTDFGKIFSVGFALIGIPLMFITAADIGKFLSETLLRCVSNWRRMVHKVKVKFFSVSLQQQNNLALTFAGTRQIHFLFLTGLCCHGFTTPPAKTSFL